VSAVKRATGRPPGLDELLERWVADELISAEQAERIRPVEQFHATPATAPPPASAAPASSTPTLAVFSRLVRWLPADPA
jgi:hypothetical protein